MARTKIVCTLGPATRNRESIRLLAEAGMSVARLNFSHGTHEEHGETIRWIREVSEERFEHIAILQDLCGPKIRTGALSVPSLDLTAGQELILTTDDVPGDASRISVNYAGLPREVSAGDSLILADGEIELHTVRVEGNDILCRVMQGGKLTARKGINLPGIALAVPSLTQKDREDLAFGVAQDVDMIAISFVRTASDVRLAKRLVTEAGGTQPIIAKIEKYEAVRNIDQILEVADGIMVARGDLGVDVPLERVPSIQKDLIRRANQVGVPVITATQMLRSMVDSPRPTRAEVTDVTNAILDGTDAVMLSEETAVGLHPRRAAGMLTKVANATEDDEYFTRMKARGLVETDKLQDVISRAAVQMAEKLKVRAIICPTLTGATARRVSRYRPKMQIIAISPDERTVRRLRHCWGVAAYKGGRQDNVDTLVADVEGHAKRLGLVSPGDRVIFIGGAPAGLAGTTNFVRVDDIR